MRDKLRVARSFSQASPAYDARAGLQTVVGAALLDLLETGCSRAPEVLIDLGCGTGARTALLMDLHPGARAFGLDLAQGMARHAASRAPGAFYVTGDMEALPFAPRVADLLYSSLAIQWCEDPASVLREAHRVLRPGGRFVFSTLLAGTLWQLEEGWRQVDSHVHVNRFRTGGDYRSLAENAGFRITAWREETRIETFPDVLALMRSVKGIGARNLNTGRRPGLTAPARIAALARAFEPLRTLEGLPLTYRVLYVGLEKPA
ncbi:malonyl-ACP O-methyltransferase BioC [Phaeovibrio sulfidiphilus]|uniref:Malonyl-[acyl-carrier protein] O-methyltransferase n=1 Tax=Phaeovibrio sulfidiphilus TaxID=1220600 RepID=A0A8J6YMV5_9PROT|nr:malonyl-ACP O-methyltransferase BioC [Phaeovibrio sulfidiphilus]